MRNVGCHCAKAAAACSSLSAGQSRRNRLATTVLTTLGVVADQRCAPILTSIINASGGLLNRAPARTEDAQMGRAVIVRTIARTWALNAVCRPCVWRSSSGVRADFAQLGQVPSQPHEVRQLQRRIQSHANRMWSASQPGARMFGQRPRSLGGQWATTPLLGLGKGAPRADPPHMAKARGDAAEAVPLLLSCALLCFAPFLALPFCSTLLSKASCRSRSPGHLFSAALAPTTSTTKCCTQAPTGKMHARRADARHHRRRSCSDKENPILDEHPVPMPQAMKHHRMITTFASFVLLLHVWPVLFCPTLPYSALL